MKTMVSTAGGGIGPIDSPDVLAPGAKAGPWIIERELGRGGMGAVYAVVHEEIGKRAALKIVHRRLLTPAFNVDRVLLEAKVVNAVGHPNIVDIFETGKLDDGRPYVVMERLEGQPLSYRADDGKIEPEQVIAILLQVCDALIAAHAANVVHRDLKLDNVFLVDNPDAPAVPKVKLLDWGIAKIINHDVRHTVEGQLVGTPQYLSPEQARGAEVSPLTDVYSLGVMAYELFLEQLPFEAETSAEIMAMHLRAVPPAPSELWPEIPPQLEDLILQMLAKHPDHRPTTLEVARRLEAARDELARQRRAPAEDAVPAVAIEAPRSVRLRSQALAPTEPADSDVWLEARDRRRWQLGVGALAMIASVTMFLVTHSGDTPIASAADLEARRALDPRGARLGPTPTEAAPAVELRAPELAAAPLVAQHLAPTVASAVMPGADPQPSRRTTNHKASAPRHASTRKAPAVPRRAAARIDPDGTIDPYR